MKNVAMMQPTFLPWQGLFELIYNSDEFIFLDDFQLCTRSYHTRNKLFIAKNSIGFYSTNIKKHDKQDIKLNETPLSNDNIWKNNILKRLSILYLKTAYYKNLYPKIEMWLLKKYSSLATLNISGILLFCDILNITTKFLYSSDFTQETKSKSTRSNRIIELLKWANADNYLCAFGSFDYMKEDNYDYIKYPVLFQNYIPKPYEQIHSQEFIPYLSVLDALFNIGPQKTLELIKNGTEKWLTWEERNMLSNSSEENKCIHTS